MCFSWLGLTVTSLALWLVKVIKKEKLNLNPGIVKLATPHHKTPLASETKVLSQTYNSMLCKEFTGVCYHQHTDFFVGSCCFYVSLKIFWIQHRQIRILVLIME